MRLDSLEAVSRGDGPLHRIPAGRKLAAALALVVVIALTPPADPRWYAAAAALLLGLALASRVSPRVLLIRLLLVEPFVLGIAVLSLFQPDGLRVFALILARGTLSLGVMLLLAATTPFADLLDVLRRLRIPSIFITTLALLYRYLFVLLEEVQRMRRARAARTFARSRRLDWRLLGDVAGRLFIRSTERAERIYAAMLARGWR